MQAYLNLIVAQETRHFNDPSIKRRYSTADTEVQPEEGETYPNIILMFGEYVGEKVSPEVVLTYGSCISIKKPSFCLEQAKQTVLCCVNFEFIFVYKVSVVILRAYT